MKSKRGYVFDANVLVSAALFHRGLPAQAVAAALDAGILLVSDDLVRELSDVLSREKFEPYVSEADRARFLQSVLHQSRLIEVVDVIQACRDPDDDKYLETAVSGAAECIVSGDEDLLVLHPFRGIPILSPRDSLDYLSSRVPQENA